MGQALGGVVSAVGQQAESEAAKNAAKFNARLSALESREAQQATRKRARQEQATNITRIAKSGVRIEGSPLEVLAENAANVERELVNIRRGDFINQISAQAQARSARTAAKLAVAGSVVSTIGTVASLGLSGAFGGGGGGASTGRTFNANQLGARSEQFGTRGRGAIQRGGF